MITIVADGGGAALVGNLLADGIFGIGVDAAYGASLYLMPNTVHAEFTKPAPVAKTPAAKTDGTS